MDQSKTTTEPSYSYWLHYDLKRDPFLDIDESRLKGLSQWDPHFELLLHLIQYSNVLLVVTGQTENGKLTLVDQFAMKVSKQLETIIIQSKPNLDPIELLETLCSQCGFLNIAVSDYELAEKYSLLIESLAQAKRKVVLLFEDAQSLPGKTLELCFKLVRQQTGHGRLHMVLFGDAMIDPLLQNIAISRNDESLLHSVNLKPFTFSETEKYLRYCLTTAGMVGRFPFKPRDIKFIHKQSGGLLGATNQCARQWLIDNAHKQRKPLLRFWKTYHLHISSGGLVLLALIAYGFGRVKETPAPTNTATLQMTRIAVLPDVEPPAAIPAVAKPQIKFKQLDLPTKPIANVTLPEVTPVTHRSVAELPVAVTKPVVAFKPAELETPVVKPIAELVQTEVKQIGKPKKQKKRPLTFRVVWHAAGQLLPAAVRHIIHPPKTHHSQLAQQNSLPHATVKIADIAQPVDELPKTTSVTHHIKDPLQISSYVPSEAREQFIKTVAALSQPLPPVEHNHIKLIESAHLHPVSAEPTMKIQYVHDEPVHHSHEKKMHPHVKQLKHAAAVPQKHVAKKVAEKPVKHKGHPAKTVAIKKIKPLKAVVASRKQTHVQQEMQPHAYTAQALSKIQKKKIAVAVHEVAKKSAAPIVAKLDIIKVDLKPAEPTSPQVHVPFILKPAESKPEVVAQVEAPKPAEPPKPVVAAVKPAEPPKPHIAASVLSMPQQVAQADPVNNPDQLDSYRSVN